MFGLCSLFGGVFSFVIFFLTESRKELWLWKNSSQEGRLSTSNLSFTTSARNL
jgi:hypothetical protein